MKSIHKDFFNVKLAMMDKRPSKIVCDVCGTTFHDRYKRECHVREKHGGMKEEEHVLKKEKLEKMELTIPGMKEILEKLAETAKKNDGVAHVTKAKPPPL